MALMLLAVAAIAPAFAEIEMEFTRWPESVTAPLGDRVSFECEVRVPGERLAWRWRPLADSPSGDWRPLPVDRGEIHISPPKADGTRLTVDLKHDSLAGEYQCVVWYGAVVLASVPARLVVARFDPSGSWADRRVVLVPTNNPVVLHCRVPSSEPPALINWWKDDRGQRRSLSTPYGVLVILNATVEDSGTYGCAGTNDLTGQSIEQSEMVILKVQLENKMDTRFIESSDYVGGADSEGSLTAAVRAGEPLRLWCGAVGVPVPHILWNRENGVMAPHSRVDRRTQMLTIAPLRPEDEGIYSCEAGGLRRAWRVLALRPAYWEGAAVGVNATEGGAAHIACGAPRGQPPPTVTWLLNAEPLRTSRNVHINGPELWIEHVEKRHAGIVQCFVSNNLGTQYDAALLTVVPVQISDQEYTGENDGPIHFPIQPSKRNNRKHPRKHKAVMVPPSRPNITRMTDDSVMVSWSAANQGLPIQFFKVQYREATNSSITQWRTANQDIPPYIRSYLVDGLLPDRYYKFRIAAVYSNQDNKLGKSSVRFYLQRGAFRPPHAPLLVHAAAVSPTHLQLNWTWSSGGGVPAEGFYVYYRAVSSAGEYEKATAPGGASARSLTLAHLAPDTAYELKVQSYTASAPSDFSAIKVAKTHRAPTVTTGGNGSSDGSSGTGEVRGGGSATGSRSPPVLITAAGAAGAATLLVALAVTLLLCRRPRRDLHAKEKTAPRPESAGTNGYIPAKVPITITANPMHTEGGDGAVEMSYLHNNNCGNTGSGDDTLPPLPRKHGPTRNYV